LPPPYSAQLLTSIERTVTRERLTRYLGATRQDISQALALYEYNVQLSEVLYGLLHGLEVAVRNAQHYALTTSYGTASWYDHAPLSQYWQDQLDKAKAQPGAAGHPGKVVAELTFGFWVDLLKNANHMRLWVQKRLYTAFPNGPRDRRLIHERLKSVQLLRNRISHHEPVLTSSNHLYTGDGIISLPELLECVEWVCTHTRHWLQAQFRYADAERVLREVAAMRVTL
jgi:hypothetical protein